MGISHADSVAVHIHGKYQCNLTDYLEAQRAQLRSSIGYRILLGMATLVLAVGAFELYELGFAKAVPAILVGVFWAACPTFLFSWRVRRDFKKHPNLSREYSLDADDSGIKLTGDFVEQAGKWPVYTKFRETPNLFMLYYGARLFLMVPKRAFQNTDLGLFRELIARNIRSA